MVKLFQAASKHISLIEEIQRREREKQANILFYFLNFVRIDTIQKVLKFSSTKINMFCIYTNIYHDFGSKIIS